MRHLFILLSRIFPEVNQSLEEARFNTSLEDYMKRVIFLGVLSGLFFCLFFFVLNTFIGLSPIWFLPVFLIGSGLGVSVLLSYPAFMVKKSNRYVNDEIVSAIRFLMLEMESGRPLFEAIENMSHNFALIGVYADEIVNRVKLGATLEDALKEAVEITPSAQFKNVLWQLLNSVQTGTNIRNALENLLQSIIEEQRIQIEEYGRELNALSLFYMIIAIVLPTIGFTLVIAVLTFAGVPIPIGILIFVWIMLTFIQYVFLNISISRRPVIGI